MSVRKVRCDAWDISLSDDERRHALQIFKGPDGERRVRSWIKDKLGIKPPAKSSLYRWKDRMDATLRPVCQTCVEKDMEISDLKGQVRTLIHELGERQKVNANKRRGA